MLKGVLDSALWEVEGSLSLEQSKSIVNNMQAIEGGGIPIGEVGITCEETEVMDRGFPGVSRQAKGEGKGPTL